MLKVHVLPFRRVEHFLEAFEVVYVLFHAFFYSYLQEKSGSVRDSRQGCPRCQEGVSDRVKNFEKCEKGKKKKDNRRKRADFACRNNISRRDDEESRTSGKR